MLFQRLLFTSYCLLHGVAALDVSLTEILALVPPCALTCIVSGVPSIPALIADPTSICSNATLQYSLSSCIQRGCNFTEQSEVAMFNQQLCKGTPIESRAESTVVAGLVFGPLAIVFVLLRCYSRYSLLKKLEADDWVISVAAVIVGGLVAADIKNATNGFGRHIWNVDPLRVESLSKVFLALELLYIVAITLIKVSILLFYLRIFPTRGFRIADFIVMGSVIAFGLAIFLVIIFQCIPISGAWNRLIPSTCMNINTLAYATGGVSVAQDFIILMLPLPQLFSLKMNRKKKFNVLFMFSLGIVACVTSIVRLKFIVDFGGSTDPTYDNAIPAIWSLVEICIATICACLPALRSLLSQWLPGLFDLTSNSKTTAISNPFFSPSSGGHSRYDQIELSSSGPKSSNEDNSVVTKIWVGEYAKGAGIKGGSQIQL